MRIAVVSDTHLSDGLTRLPSPVRQALEESDLVLHGGDITTRETLRALSEVNLVHAVLGNNDRELLGQLPETRVLHIEGITIGMVHDSGTSNRRAAHLKEMFPSADLVVFGHSHVPFNEAGIAGQLLFNPGSPTQRRGQPFASFGLLQIEDGTIREHRVKLLRNIG